LGSQPRAASRIEQDGPILRFGEGPARVSVTVCTSRIVRIELAGEAPDGAPSYVGPRAWPGAAVHVDDGEPVRMVTADLGVEVSIAPVRLAFLDRTGTLLLHQPADGGMTAERSADGRTRVHARFAFTGEQHFYGLGQGGLQLDRLGVSRQLWNTHLGHGPGSDIGVPLLLSNRGYALFFDNPSDAQLTVGRSDDGVRIVYTAASGRLTWYFLIGRDMRATMHEVAELLGHAPMLPRWALGFLQSTRHFHDTAELRRLPRTIRDKRIPCDGLIYLSTYGEARGWNRGVGHLEFQPELWPDPAGLLAEARNQHFELMTHEYPVLHEDSREGQRYLDFSNADVRRWWWAAHRELVLTSQPRAMFGTIFVPV
jgi:alpha-glucosidase (family GH31 glycosyl hydrolase)